MSKTKKNMLILGTIVALLFIFLIAANYIYVNKNETLLYKVQQHLTYSKEDSENYQTNQRILTENPTDGSGVTEASAAPDKYDLYPVDINKVPEEFKEAELEKLNKAGFESLILAKKAPDNEDAQIALIRFTERRLTDVIIHQKISIKVGKCYENPEKDDNFRCVSCMILLYNRDKKDWVEAPNGDNFLKTAYDFYQPSDGEQWEARDLTMRIPFDHDLFNKYTATKFQ